MNATYRLRQTMLAFAGLVGCAEHTPVGPGESIASYGRVIGRESLISADGNQLPCCAVDDHGARIFVVGGELTFHAPVNYPDTVATPGGMMSRSCVRTVSSGIGNGSTNVVRLSDGSSYLLVPCATGNYRFTLTRRLVYPNGQSRTDTVTVSFGLFWTNRDELTLKPAQRAHRLQSSLSGVRTTIAAAGRQYQFLPAPTR